MNIKVVFGWLTSGLVMLCYAQSASAVSNCGRLTSVLSFDGSMALNITRLAAPRDAPIGTVLYRQQFQQAGEGVSYQCDLSAGALNRKYFVSGLGRKLDFNSGSYAGKVYATSVPGIGVSWWSGSGDVGVVGADMLSQSDPGGCVNNGVNGGRTCQIGPRKLGLASMHLIKTGAIGVGTIQGGELGKMNFTFSVGDSADHSISAVGITGSINVVSTTCRTPDITVRLGSHKTSTFTGIGSSSPQVDFAVRLEDCPGFPGYYAGTSIDDIPTASQSAVINIGKLTPNTVAVRIDPVYTAIDAANGVLSLTPGTGVATGVGVQLLHASGETFELSRSTETNAVDPTLSNFVLDIRLVARYLQTANTVTAGSANAVANYTIIYQ